MELILSIARLLGISCGLATCLLLRRNKRDSWMIFGFLIGLSLFTDVCGFSTCHYIFANFSVLAFLVVQYTITPYNY